MKLGILSDTHDNLDLIKKAFSKFSEEKVDLIIHCGDWTKLETLDYVCEILIKNNLTCKSCFGNNDREILKYFKNKDNVWIYKDLVEFVYEDYLLFEEDGNKIAICHGKDQRVFSKLVKDDEISYLFYGHTHIGFFGRLNEKFVMNPGSVKPEKGKSTIGIVDTAGSGSGRLVEL